MKVHHVASAASTGDPANRQSDRDMIERACGAVAHGFERRRFLRAGGLGLAVVASGGLLRTPFGSAIAALGRRPMAAQADVEVQILQTAASLENLAVAAYQAVLDLPSLANNPLIGQFIETTISQHSDHGIEFNAVAETLGGAPQDAVNPTYADLVSEMPASTDAATVIQLAATLEEVMAATYLANLALLPDPSRRALMASVMCVETQHLAVLRTVGALLAANAPALIALPTDLSTLPVEALGAGFPQPFETTNLASPPAEGAVR